MSETFELGTPAETIRDISSRVPALEPSWREYATRRLDSLTKPIGSLGRLEEIATRLAMIQRKQVLEYEKKTIFAMAADHGVTEEAVSPYPKAVTHQMVLNYLAGGAAINVLCRQFGIEVVVVDIGVDAELGVRDGLTSRKIAHGTRNMARGPAMTEAELAAALHVGLELASNAAERGRVLIGTGEMGIGNTTAASAITAALAGKPVAAVTGPGAGLNTEGVQRKIAAIESALAVNRPNPSDPLDILQKVGGLEIAGLTGLILGGAAARLAIVVDGFISTSAAALACAIQPRVRTFLFAAHQSCEPGHTALLQFIEQKPLVDLGMRLGEGTGAALGMALVESAAKLFNEMATFDSAGVSGAVG